jgi:hypothetical protein
MYLCIGEACAPHTFPSNLLDFFYVPAFSKKCAKTDLPREKGHRGGLQSPVAVRGCFGWRQNMLWFGHGDSALTNGSPCFGWRRLLAGSDPFVLKTKQGQTCSWVMAQFNFLSTLEEKIGSLVVEDKVFTSQFYLACLKTRFRE